MSAARKVDQNALRTHQAILIILLIAVFIAGSTALVAFAAVVMIIGALYPPARLFVRFYQHMLIPSGLLKPDVIEDNPEPHRFAMGVGGLFLAGSTLALLAGASVIGWILSGIVVVLAALNLFLGFCAGCFMYYQFNKLGIPGFEYAPMRIKG